MLFGFPYELLINLPEFKFELLYLKSNPFVMFLYWSFCWFKGSDTSEELMLLFFAYCPCV